MNSPEAINCRGITTGAGDFLRDLSFVIPRGHFVSVVGPNGSGKSTLLAAMTGLSPYRGLITLFGTSLEALSRKQFAQQVGVVPDYAPAVFDFTVEEFVSSGLAPFWNWWGMPPFRKKPSVREALLLLEAEAFAQRSLAQLSAGELQRVHIARALVHGPSLLILDEPTSHMDLGHAQKIFALLDRLKRETHTTVVCVCHDLILAAHYSDCVLLLAEGRLVGKGSPEEVFTPSLLETAYRSPFWVDRDPRTLKLVPRVQLEGLLPISPPLASEL